ncbi:MAG TPA: cytochrome P450 [Acidimicrobiia bacterium]|nr:cytochrome P450 [Acidimicrobiia bacterium]
MPDTDDRPGAPLAADPALARNPQPTYRSLVETTPVFRMDGVGVVAASRAAADTVLRHPDMFSSNMSAIDLKTRRPLIPMSIDPPAHRKYRKLLDPLFAPQRMKLLEDPVTRLANELIDGFVDDDEVDFAARFSVPLPSQVFLTMLGLPLDELPRFLEMKDGIIRPQVVVGQPLGHPETDRHQQATADAIYAYFEKLLDERAGVRRDDLVSHFLDAEVEGERLTRDEIVDIGFQLLIAGLDTVTAALDCSFGYLARHPDGRRQIVEHPESIPSTVEELLRWETPVMAVARVATGEGELGDCPIHAGDQVLALIGAANLDDHDCPGANELRWDREANRHLAFGGGIHRCLGSHLARLELRVALREWHRRIPEYRVSPGTELDYSPGIRSVDAFPMLLGPRPERTEERDRA